MMIYDYKCYGMIMFFVVFDVKLGLVIGECMLCYCAREFLCFLCCIDWVVKKLCDIYLVFDNYVIYKMFEV